MHQNHKPKSPSGLRDKLSKQKRTTLLAWPFPRPVRVLPRIQLQASGGQPGWRGVWGPAKEGGKREAHSALQEAGGADSWDRVPTRGAVGRAAGAGRSGGGRGGASWAGQAGGPASSAAGTGRDVARSELSRGRGPKSHACGGGLPGGRRLGSAPSPRPPAGCRRLSVLC